MFNRVVTSAFIVLSTVAIAGDAFAHAHLKASMPADKSMVAAAPKTLNLSFTETLNLKFSGVEVTGPDKAVVKTGEAALSDKDTGLTVPVLGTLPAGDYTVKWHVLSTDGHKTSGSFGFVVKP